MRRSSLRIPGRGGGRQAAPFKDLRPPGPSGGRALCAPSHQRLCVASPAPVVVSSAGSGDHDIRYFHRGGVRVYSWAQSATTQSRSASRPSSPAFSVRAVRASCRLTQLRCWVVPGRDSSSSASSGRRVPSLHSKVELNLAAIPPHLRRGEPRRKCSGRPGHGRPGRWRRQCPSSRLCVRCFAPATNPCCPPQTARFCPHQRCSVLLLFEGLCLFAFALVPRSTVSAALTPLGRSGRWRRHCQFGPQLRRSPNCQRLRGSARISGVA